MTNSSSYSSRFHQSRWRVIVVNTVTEDTSSISASHGTANKHFRLESGVPKVGISIPLKLRTRYGSVVGKPTKPIAVSTRPTTTRGAVRSGLDGLNVSLEKTMELHGVFLQEEDVFRAHPEKGFVQVLISLGTRIRCIGRQKYGRVESTFLLIVSPKPRHIYGSFQSE